jgi:predicted amidophosphoribosyltransferase
MSGFGDTYEGSTDFYKDKAYLENYNKAADKLIRQLYLLENRYKNRKITKQEFIKENNDLHDKANVLLQGIDAEERERYIKQEQTINLMNALRRPLSSNHTTYHRNNHHRNTYHGGSKKTKKRKSKSKKLKTRK